MTYSHTCILKAHWEVGSCVYKCYMKWSITTLTVLFMLFKYGIWALVDTCSYVRYAIPVDKGTYSSNHGSEQSWVDVYVIVDWS